MKPCWGLMTASATIVVSAALHPQGAAAVAVEVSTVSQSGGSNMLIDQNGLIRSIPKFSNISNPFRALSGDEAEYLTRERKKRMRERRERARELLKNRRVPPPQRDSLEPMSKSHLKRVLSQPQNQKQQNRRNKKRQESFASRILRELGWFSSSDNSDALADPSAEYDKWAQGYRMLGGMIDCDHDKSEGSGSGNNQNGGEKDGACSRWMVWAAYVNPNYQGNAYNEYFGDEPTGVLDCHEPYTEWELLGVYRQEFYQFIEQISKHLWAIDDYEYVVALAGLAYMTDAVCFSVGYDNSGNSIYAGVAPQQYGKFEMALYTDDYCLEPDESLGMTYDDFGMQNEINLGSKDATDDDSYSWAYDWWYDTQEYTLTQLNDVYEDYKYCTSCVDYPTYQDGYFIGDYGTDDDDLINQCWKFYSHDSYTCDADCMAKAHAQGTIMSVTVGDTTFGKTPSSFYSSSAKTSTSTTAESSVDSPFTRLMANAALTASFLLFVATFLAFAVARRSRYRESRSGRSRRLLDDADNDQDARSRKSRRSSKSRASDRSETRSNSSRGREKSANANANEEEGDGLFRTSARSKSASRRDKSRKSSSSRSRKKRRSRSYDPPKESVVSPRPKNQTVTRADEFF